MRFMRSSTFFRWRDGGMWEVMFPCWDPRRLWWSRRVSAGALRPLTGPTHPERTNRLPPTLSSPNIEKPTTISRIDTSFRCEWFIGSISCYISILQYQKLLSSCQSHRKRALPYRTFIPSYSKGCAKIGIPKISYNRDEISCKKPMDSQQESNMFLLVI